MSDQALSPNTVRLTWPEIGAGRILADSSHTFYELLAACFLTADVVDRKRLGGLFVGVAASLGDRAGVEQEGGADREPLVLGAGQSVLIASQAYLDRVGAVLVDDLTPNTGGRGERKRTRGS